MPPGLEKASPELRQHVNRHGVLRAGKQILGTDEFKMLRQFERRFIHGRLNFGKTDNKVRTPKNPITKRAAAEAKKKTKKPKDGKVLLQDPYQVMSGIHSVLPRPDALEVRLRKRMRKDPQIALGLAAIKAPIMGAFESIKVDCKDPKIRGFVEQILMHQNGSLLRRMVYSALRALDFGFVAHEKVWRNGVRVEFAIQEEEDQEPSTIVMDNCTVLEDVCDLDPEYTEIIMDGNEYAGLRYAGSENQKLPAEKTWLVTHDKEFGHLLGSSVLDPVYNPWYWCDIMYLFTNRYYERKATPPIKGRAPTLLTDNDGNTVAGATVFASMLESLVSEGVVVLPSETQGEGRSEKFVWDAEYMPDDKRGEMFITYIEHLQTLKLRGILIPEMVVEKGGQAGTYGMARAHTDTFVGMLTLILEEILQHINRWIIPEIIEHNFGLDSPPCTIETLVKIGDRKDLLEELLLEIIKAESKAGSLDTGRIVDIIALLRQLNVNFAPRRDLPDFEEKQRRQAEQVQATNQLRQQTAAAAKSGVKPPVGKAKTGKKVKPPATKGRPADAEDGNDQMKMDDVASLKAQIRSLRKRLKEMDTMGDNTVNLEPGSGIPADGTYQALHSGYQIVFSVNSELFVGKTERGVRGINLPATVHVLNGVCTFEHRMA